MGFVVSVLLLRQFSLLLPLFGAVDVYIDDREGMPGVAVSQRVCETVMAVSTFLAMWSFKCLLPLMTRSIRAEDIDPERISAMERRHMEPLKKHQKHGSHGSDGMCSTCAAHVQHRASQSMTPMDPYGPWPHMEFPQGY
jgi:hypothetical protein